MSLSLHRAWAETMMKTGMAATYSAVPVQFQNAAFRQPEGPWCQFHIIDGSAFQVELTGPNARERHTGFVQVNVFVPQNTGTAKAIEIAEYVGSLFRRKMAQLSDGAAINHRTPYYTATGTTNGFFCYIVTIPYWRDEPRR